MRNLFILALVFSSVAQARTYHLTVTDPIVDKGRVPASVNVDFSGPNKSHLTPQLRDKLLVKHFPKHVGSLDDVERDILYKAILHYPDDKLKIKYPFLKSYNLPRLRNEFK